MTCEVKTKVYTRWMDEGYAVSKLEPIPILNQYTNWKDAIYEIVRTERLTSIDYIKQVNYNQELIKFISTYKKYVRDYEVIVHELNEVTNVFEIEDLIKLIIKDFGKKINEIYKTKNKILLLQFLHVVEEFWLLYLGFEIKSFSNKKQDGDYIIRDTYKLVKVFKHIQYEISKTKQEWKELNIIRLELKKLGIIQYDVVKYILQSYIY